MGVFDTMQQEGHEDLVFCTDQEAGLRALICIHDTTLGPALGGIRLRGYENESLAVTDALRLSQAMTYKASLAGLAYGGGKAVVLSTSKELNREVLFRALGRSIHSLRGRYIPTEDMGTTTADIEHVLAETCYGVGRSQAFGGGGDPSPMTAWGVFCGLRACLQQAGTHTEFESMRVAIPGLGKVGYALARYLNEAGAKLLVADIDQTRTRAAVEEFGAEVMSPEQILEAPCDILAPCAAGAILNPDSISKLRCRIVGGGANNQLQSEGDGDLLLEKGIIYAPDFAINAGGLINVADELGPGGYRRERAKTKTEEIYSTVKRILADAAKRNVSPHRVAVDEARKRIASMRQLRRNMNVTG